MPPESVEAAPRELEASRAGARHGAEIAAVAMAVPERVVPNSAISSRLGVNDDWIHTRTGIRERRFAAPGETLSELAALAGHRALAVAAADPAELGLVLVATLTSDRRLPNTAPLVAGELGAPQAEAVDIGAACTGFLSALDLAAGQVEAGRVDSALVIGAELLSPVVDPDDRRTAGLFGDGAGAVLVRRSDGPGRLGRGLFASDSEGSELITLEADGFVRMNGHDTFRHAVARLSEVTLATLARDGRTVADVDLFVFHQANGRILQAVAEQAGIPVARVAEYIARFGNTSSASIPIALAQAEADGRLRDGATVLMAAFGSGLAWGAMTMEWGGGDGA